MLPFQGNVSDALVVLAATIAASSNQWFSDSSLVSLHDRVFDVVQSNPCYIGLCNGPERILHEKRVVREMVLSGNMSAFQAAPTPAWKTYFDECRPMLSAVELHKPADVKDALFWWLMRHDYRRAAQYAFKSARSFTANYSLHDIDTIAAYLEEKKDGRAHADAMLRACGVDYEGLWLATRSAADVSHAFEMRQTFIREDLAVLANAAMQEVVTVSGSGNG